MDIKYLAVILFGSILTNNYVLARFLGICPFLGVSKKLDQASGMGIAVTAVITNVQEATISIITCPSWQVFTWRWVSTHKHLICLKSVQHI